MTDAQKRVVGNRLAVAIRDNPAGVIFHHGCCVGADREAATIAEETCNIVEHPGPEEDHRQTRPRHAERRAPKGHLARNRDIVNECDLLIATPFERAEQQRGGTWYTIRYARKVGKPLLIVFPDGSILQI